MDVLSAFLPCSIPSSSCQPLPQTAPPWNLERPTLTHLVCIQRRIASKSPSSLQLFHSLPPAHSRSCLSLGMRDIQRPCSDLTAVVKHKHQIKIAIGPRLIRHVVLTTRSYPAPLSESNPAVHSAPRQRQVILPDSSSLDFSGSTVNTRSHPASRLLHTSCTTSRLCSHSIGLHAPRRAIHLSTFSCLC